MAQAPGQAVVDAPQDGLAPFVQAEPVVRLAELTKKFGDKTVVDRLTMSVAPGQIYGLIGPSGCGKTTTIRLLLGVLAPTAGEIRVLGVDPRRFTTRHRERIGYTPQGFFLYPTLTVEENANFVARLFGVGWRQRRRRVPEVLKFLEIWEARRRLARDISGGMQRRLTLACALIHEPPLLFVDEPTAGLDPVLREKIWDHLRQLRDRGTTIFVTTQYIDEAAYCDTVAVMNQGRLAAVGSPQELRQRAMGGDVVEVEAEPVTREDIVALRKLAGVHAVQWTDSGALRVMVEDTAPAIPLIAQLLQERGANVNSLDPYTPSFDEVFMKIVGRRDDQE